MGKYDHLLEPIMVAGHVFKNRICMTPTTPQFLQDAETWPAENLMQHYWLRAKNGVALMTLSGLYPFNDENPMPYAMRDYFQFDIEGGYNHYLAQLIEGVHGFGTYCTIQMQHKFPAGWDVCKGAASFEASFTDDQTFATHEITPYEFQASTEQLVKECMILKDAGLDGIFLHMSYQMSTLGRTLSPLVNKRDDEYGGTFEKRLKLVTDTCSAIKQACGRGFIIEAHITGEERDLSGNLIPGGWRVEDSVRFAEAMSGLIDILHLRGWNVDKQHPTWYTADEPPYLYLAEACKQAVTETKILTTSGHKNPDAMEAALAEGKADLIGMARQMVADPDFILKLAEDRADDIRPCIRCNRCFEVGMDGVAPRTNRCSVNPEWGFEFRVGNLFTPSAQKKKVAVVGGGPTGMVAAITCKKRGHEVSLFETADKLGGQLNIADESPRKWALRGYRDYLVHQVDKLGIDVRMGVQATPEILDGEGFDAVIAAMGSAPALLPIPGADGDNVFTVFDAYGNEAALGQSVAIIGGGSTGIETGLHLAEDFGIHATVLEMTDMIGCDMPPTHYRVVFESAWESMENLEPIVNARVTAIEDGAVRYLDADGVEQTVPCDSVIMCAGMKARFEDAMKLYPAKARMILVGDNRQPGNVMHAVRDAYWAACQI